MGLYDVPNAQLLVPVVTYSDFSKALTKAHSSVATEELDRFQQWTAEFGQEG
jgi:vacuolar protein-sorting-associated protein 4